MNLLKMIVKKELSDDCAFAVPQREFSEKKFAGLIKRVSREFGKYDLEQGNRILILVPKSVFSVACIYCCVLNGYIFIPVDTEIPLKRLAYIVEDCCPSLIVIANKLYEKISEDATVLNLFNSNVLVIDDVYIENMYESSETLESIPYNESLKGTEGAYIIYTSGSTGTPKGVLVGRDALSYFLVAAMKRAEYRSGMKFLSFFPLHFDPVLMEIFVPWILDGKTFIYKKFLYINDLIAKMQENEISDFSCTPNIITMLLSKISLFKKYDWTHLKSIWFGGESANISDLIEIKNIVPQLRLFNGYGPTETVVACSLYEVQFGELNDDVLSIGKPFDEVQFIVVQDDKEVLCDDQVGELYVGGKQLMMGYWNRDIGIDKSCFCIINNEVYYKTGDLVYKKDDRYFFVGRINSMIKLRGYRIYPSEIEKVLYSINEITGAFVYCEKSKLIAVIEYAEDRKKESDNIFMEKIREALTGSLPRYMIPEVIKIVEKLPRNNAGKLDIALIKKIGNEGL